MPSDTTPETVAQRMLDQLDQRPELCKIDAVDGTVKNFGTEFTYTNRNGNPAIKKSVLDAFYELHGGTMTWERWGRYWRKKQPGDPDGRQVR
jgi:hypothetical protein